MLIRTAFRGYSEIKNENNLKEMQKKFIFFEKIIKAFEKF